MGKRGPQPKPAEINRLHGNPGKRPIKDVPTAPAGVPPCPEDLADVKAEWDRYGEMLSGLGVLRETDAVMYEAMWRTWAKYSAITKRSAMLNDMVEDIDAGETPEILESCIRIIAKIEPLELQYLAALVRLLDHFGMSPSSRSSLSVEKPAEPSEFDQFLAKRKELAVAK